MFGVLAFVLPKQDRSPQPISSINKRMIFGGDEELLAWLNTAGANDADKNAVRDEIDMTHSFKKFKHTIIKG
jgi:hypothetical protein